MSSVAAGLSPSQEPPDPCYPLGRFSHPEVVTPEQRTDALAALAEMPEQLREAVRSLDDEQLDTPYRKGGWTVRQLVHHMADSHGIAFDRFRRALTEDWPEVRGYNEKGFATLADTAAPVEWSLEIVESVHARWILLLQHLEAGAWQRGVVHNERGRLPLDHMLLLYAWHGRHHVAHIQHLRLQHGW